MFGEVEAGDHRSVCPHPHQVFKNRKMAGRMGGKQRTIKSVWVYKVDPARSLLWVRGQVRMSALESNGLGFPPYF